MQTKQTEALAKAIKSGASGLDVMHGQLKNLMYEYSLENPEPKNYEAGYLRALEDLYQLTYDIYFAIEDNKPIEYAVIKGVRYEKELGDSASNISTLKPKSSGALGS